MQRKVQRSIIYTLAVCASLTIVMLGGYVINKQFSFFVFLFEGKSDEESTLLPTVFTDDAHFSFPLESLLLRAEESLRDGDPAQAIVFYEQALERGGDITVMRRLFDAALLVGDQEQLNSVLGLLSFRGVPENALDALRGLMLVRAGKTAEARTIFEQHVQYSDHRFGLLIVSILQGLHAEAEEHVDVLLTSSDPLIVHSASSIRGAYDEFALFEDGRPSHRDTLIARALGQIGQWSAAVRLLTEITVSESEYRDAWILFGYSLLMIGENEQALTAFQEAYAIDPEKSETQFFLARAYERIGNEVEALKFYGYALQNGFIPRSFVREKLATLAVDRGALEEAVSQLYAIVEESEATESTYRSLITILIEDRNDVERARVLALQAQEELGEESADVLDLVGWTALVMGDVDEAATLLSTAVKQDPTLAVAWLHKGQLEEQVGDRDAALASYKHAYDEAIGSDTDIAMEAATRYNELLVVE